MTAALWPARATRGSVFRPAPPRAEASAWERALYLGTNASFFALMTPVRLTLRCRTSDGGLALLEQARREPTVFCGWHRFAYLSMALAEGVPRELRPTLIAHDGHKSRINQLCTPWMGQDVFVFSWKHPRSPGEQIATFMQETGRSVLVFADAGGPYGQVKPGLTRLAAAVGAGVQTFAVRPLARTVRVVGHHVPLPFASVELVLGARLPTPTEAALQQAMEELESP